MQGFSSSFLIFFYQIALGGMFALAGTPFHEIERGFYKSTAGVLYFIALAGFVGKSSFYLHGVDQSVSLGLGLEIFFHSAFILAFTAYMISLWGERQLFRARSFSATVLTGLAGLLISTHSFSSAPLLAVESVIYPAAFFLSSLLLGSVTVGMLIGHWYLIDTGQSLDPFIRIYKFFVYALAAQCLFYLLAPVGLYLAGSPASVKALQRLWQHHATLLVSRLIAGQFAPLILSWMIWRTLLIPHTMAATGLFYIALLGVFVGEILGRQILALTSLPF
jgi:hypothetical protein